MHHVPRLVLRLRHPGWCRQLSVRLNGRKLIDSDEAGRYVELAHGYYNLYWRVA